MKDLLSYKLITTERIPLQEVLTAKGNIYTYLNPVSYLEALKDKGLFSEFDGIFADGGLLVKAVRLLYGKNIHRRSFDMTSMAPILFEYAAKHKKSIAIIASRQEHLESAIGILQTHYPGLEVVYSRNGYFSNDDEKDKEAHRITDINPDYLIVGMGAIMQEDFLLKVKLAGYKGIGFTCGGFIHQTSHNLAEYYPCWIDRLGLRFLYRMYREPHTRARYLNAAFVFPLKFIGERLGLF